MRGSEKRSKRRWGWNALSVDRQAIIVCIGILVLLWTVVLVAAQTEQILR